MGLINRTNDRIAAAIIPGFDDLEGANAKNRCGLAAGWFSFSLISLIFIIKLALGILSGSIAVLANAFHLISHTANSLVLVLSFNLRMKPATSKTPFGHGRIEHVAPLIISIFLFVTGVRIGEESVHQVIDPHAVHYFAALPWILLASIAVKLWLGRFMKFLGTRVDSRTILTAGQHHTIEAFISFTVIAGLVFGRVLHLPVLDGIMGLGVSFWILFLGIHHAREAVVPLLGEAPGRELVEDIRATAKSVDGVEDVHEVIVHDYGSMYLISLHAEMPEKMGAVQMHEVAEIVEDKLRNVYGGEAVCHTDPLVEQTEYVSSVERQFASILDDFPEIIEYNDFRVIAKSPEKIILVADINVSEEVPPTDYSYIQERLDATVRERMEDIAYSSFYITPKFAY